MRIEKAKNPPNNIPITKESPLLEKGSLLRRNKKHKSEIKAKTKDTVKSVLNTCDFEFLTFVFMISKF